LQHRCSIEIAIMHRQRTANLAKRPAAQAVAAISPWDPAHASFAYGEWVSRMWTIWWTRNAGKAAIDAARRDRFNALVQFARRRSPVYRDAFRGVTEGRLDSTELPVMTKRALMSRFDDWVTDPAIKRTGVEAFLKDRNHIGDRYLGRYVIWKSSGTTGEPGIYVQDDDALGIYDALIAVQLASPHLIGNCAWGSIAKGGRAALIAATGDHFASVASWERVSRGSPGLAARGFSLMQPLDRLVDALNEYQPAFLASYPTMLALLAEEAEAGRLRIKPAILWSGGETFSDLTRNEIERAFGCPAVNEYGASECMSIAFSCPEGWLHVNADWVLLEPVDGDYRPTIPGDASTTVLVTNLANRVQPIIRYDLGDSVTVHAEPCACGNPLPAIRVDGRRDEVLSLQTADGDLVRLLPLAITTVVEDAIGAHRFQIAQVRSDVLAVRFDIKDAARKRAAWRAASRALCRYLRSQSLPNVQVVLDDQCPVTDPRSGKLREVIVAERRS
jgi:phenylacetate-coenzyme A ligase PaaK-like adenylate-forming protein